MQGTDRKYVIPGTKASEEFAKLDERLMAAERDELEGRGVDITGALDRGEIDVTRTDKERFTERFLGTMAALQESELLESEPALDRGEEIDVEETRADKDRYGAIEGLGALVADFLASDSGGYEADGTPGTVRRQHAKVMQILSDRLAETVTGLLACEPDDGQLRCVGAVVSQWVYDRFGV